MSRSAYKPKNTPEDRAASALPCYEKAMRRCLACGKKFASKLDRESHVSSMHSPGRTQQGKAMNNKIRESSEECMGVYDRHGLDSLEVLTSMAMTIAVMAQLILEKDPTTNSLADVRDDLLEDLTDILRCVVK
jgi:hypothetical protein